MQYITVTERVGEYLGPIDWSYDFDAQSNGVPAEWRERCIAWLRQLDAGLAAGEEWQATTDGGWPKFGWQRVLRVGMWDGWPYWRPVPSVQMLGPLGAEWHSWTSISGAEKR